MRDQSDSLCGEPLADALPSRRRRLFDKPYWLDLVWWLASRSGNGAVHYAGWRTVTQVEGLYMQSINGLLQLLRRG